MKSINSNLIMERKYQVKSAFTILPMLVNVKKKDSDEFFSVSIGVDYSQDKIVFNGEKIPGIDYYDLEQEILSFLRPPIVTPPTISPDILDQVRKVQKGDYQGAFNQTMPEIHR